MSESLAANPAAQGTPGHAVSVAGSPIPFKRDGAAGSPDMSAGAIGVLAISLLAIAAVWMMRKRLNLVKGGGTTRTSLRILESQRLGPKAILTVVEFAGSQHLLAYSEHGVQALVSAPAQQTGVGDSR
jgi:flagellar biogenesis protein FliO